MSHANYEYANVINQCGMPAEFPGCLTLWESTDGGDSFDLQIPVCLMSCTGCPCDDQRDHITTQQYPRIAIAEDVIWYMAYEWHAQTMLRTSQDGWQWSDWEYLTNPAGTWHTNDFPCTDIERIGSHPNIRGEVHNCLVGAPPGIYVEEDMLYVFVSAGHHPNICVVIKVVVLETSAIYNSVKPIHCSLDHLNMVMLNNQGSMLIPTSILDMSAQLR